MSFNPLRSLARSLAHTAPMRFMVRGTDKKLSELGLLYDDLIIETPTVTLALQRLSEEERQARWRRIKRAIDLDVKHATIPVADQVSPRQYYLQEHIADVERLEAERAALDMD